MINKKTLTSQRNNNITPQYSTITKVLSSHRNHQAKTSFNTIHSQSVYLQIQLDDGKIQRLSPSISDDPYKLALQFCQKYQLDDEMILVLGENIRKTIKKLKGNILEQQVKQKKKRNQGQQKQQKVYDMMRCQQKYSSKLMKKQKGKYDSYNFDTEPNIMPTQYDKFSEEEYKINQIFNDKNSKQTNIPTFHKKQNPSNPSNNITNRSLTTPSIQKPQHHQQSNLYNRWLSQQQSKKLWIEKQRQQKVRKELQKCTYSPGINKISEQICLKKSREGLMAKSSSRNSSKSSLLAEGRRQSINRKNYNSKYSSIRTEPTQWSEEIIDLSSTLLNQKAPNSEHRKIKQSKTNTKQSKQFKFIPQINQNSRKLVGDKSFQERMNIYKSKSNKSLSSSGDYIQKHKRDNKSSFNMRDNGSSFSTKDLKRVQGLNNVRTVCKEQNVMNKNTFQRVNSSDNRKNSFSFILLDNINKNKSKTKTPSNSNRNNLQKSPHIKISHRQKTPFPPSSSFLQPKYKKPHQQLTQILYNNKKQKSFQKIFLLLDSDNNDGLISILRINLLNGVEEKLIKILFPLLEELEILETELNMKEFCDAVQNLFKGLSLEQKDYLLRFGGGRKQERTERRYQTLQNQKNNGRIKHSYRLMTQQDCLQNQNQLINPLNFKPLSPKKNTKNTQPQNKSSRKYFSVYQYSKIRQQLKKQYLQRQRVLKQQNSMKQCTFYPKINPKNKKNLYF